MTCDEQVWNMTENSGTDIKHDEKECENGDETCRRRTKKK